MSKEPIKKEDLKFFEVEIKAKIIYTTLSWVDSYSFDCEAAQLIEDLFEEVGIQIKKNEKGIIELEILGVKEIPQKGEKDEL